MFEVDYWWLTLDDVWDNEDLFGFIAHTISGSPEGLRRFWYGWQATKAGRRTGTIEFQAELEDHVRKG